MRQSELIWFAFFYRESKISFQPESKVHHVSHNLTTSAFYHHFVRKNCLVTFLFTFLSTFLFLGVEYVDVSQAVFPKNTTNGEYCDVIHDNDDIKTNIFFIILSQVQCCHQEISQFRMKVQKFLQVPLHHQVCLFI